MQKGLLFAPAGRSNWTNLIIDIIRVYRPPPPLWVLIHLSFLRRAAMFIANVNPFKFTRSRSPTKCIPSDGADCSGRSSHPQTRNPHSYRVLHSHSQVHSTIKSRRFACIPCSRVFIGWARVRSPRDGWNATTHTHTGYRDLGKRRRMQQRHLGEMHEGRFGQVLTAAGFLEMMRLDPCRPTCLV